VNFKPNLLPAFATTSWDLVVNFTLFRSIRLDTPEVVPGALTCSTVSAVYSPESVTMHFGSPGACPITSRAKSGIVMRDIQDIRINRFMVYSS
jgi:hypothetical protein